MADVQLVDTTPFINVLARITALEAARSSSVSGGAVGIPALHQPYQVSSLPNSSATDAAWQTLDLSPYIPKGLTMVYIELGLYFGAALDANTYWALKAFGDFAGGTDATGEQRFYPPTTIGVYHNAFRWVRISPDGKLQFKRVNGSGGASRYWVINLWGYA